MSLSSTSSEACWLQPTRPTYTQWFASACALQLSTVALATINTAAGVLHSGITKQQQLDAAYSLPSTPALLLVIAAVPLKSP
jgi:hypothetical protein